MSHDLLMLRGDVAGGFNLAVGEPVFLQQALGDLSKHFLPPPDMRYPPFAGTKSLIEALRQYHNNQYEHFVVTVGAKQALVAAFQALKCREGFRAATHRAPYWPSYSTLVRASGLEFVDGAERQRLPLPLKLGTLVNNPDGAICTAEVDVLDCAYAHPVYGWAGQEPPHRVAVYSAAKLFGLSGLRIGWLATNDRDIARLAGEYVEKATSGVSTHDQYALEGVIRAANEGVFHRSYQVARSMLDENRRALDQELGLHIEDVHADAGMFAWFRPRDGALFQRALESSNVKLIPGTACGGPASCYRMSLGHDPEYTHQALTALRHHLESH